MKKIFIALLILSCMAGLTACSHSDDYSDVPNALKIDSESSRLELIRSEVIFGPTASQGLIEVNTAAPVEAVSSEEWCTVSVNGNIVNVAVTDWTEVEGRNALVSVSSAGKSIDVAVHQNGAVFATDAPTVLSSDYDAQQFEFKLKTNVDVELSTSDDWITAEIVNGKLVISVDENTTGAKRTGYVYYKYGNSEGQIQVTQIDFAIDVLGEYQLWYSRSATSAQWAYLPVTLKANSIDFTVSGANFSIPITFVNGENAPYVISVADEQYVGDYSTYSCYLGFDTYAYNLYGRYKSYFFSVLGESVSTITLEEAEYDGAPYFGGLVDGLIMFGDEPLDEEDGVIDTWLLLAMNSQEYSQSSLAGALLTMYYPQIEKVFDTGAASRRNAPAKIRKQK